MKKASDNQVVWALLTEGVTQARLDAHRVQLLIDRAVKLVEASSDKEHLYQVAGDIIQGLPERMGALKGSLDRTNWALAKMGAEIFEDMMPLADKALVQETVKPILAKRLAARYMKERGLS